MIQRRRKELLRSDCQVEVCTLDLYKKITIDIYYFVHKVYGNATNLMNISKEKLSKACTRFTICFAFKDFPGITFSCVWKACHDWPLGN